MLSSFLSSLLLFSLGAFGPQILLVSRLSPYLSPLFSPSSILTSLVVAILLSDCFGENGFPGLLCFSLLAFLYANLFALGRNDEIYCLLHSFILGHDHMPPYLPSYLSPTYSISLCSLHCHASLRVFSSREESFSPTTFLSLLVPLVFPSAFFICLLIHYCCSLWVLFGARTSPCLPRVSRLYDL